MAEAEVEAFKQEEEPLRIIVEELLPVLEIKSKKSSKVLSGRLTPPSCYSGGLGSKQSSRIGDQFNETGSV